MRVCIKIAELKALSVFAPLSVEGGELFDRIIDENYNLTELDTVLFIRQICEGLQYMHKMYILHLDLKVNPLQFRLLHSSSYQYFSHFPPFTVMLIYIPVFPAMHSIPHL